MKYKKTHSIEELIKLEQKSRQMALALERKAEYFRSQANKYLKMLKDKGASTTVEVKK